MTRIAASGLFDADSAVGYLVRHAIPGVEVVDPDARSITRLLRNGGELRPITVRLQRTGVHVELAGGNLAEPDSAVIDLVRGWFDLDADLDAVGAVLDRDPMLAAAGRAFPGLRIVGFPDAFEAAVTTVLGQQVSLTAMRTFAGRIAAGYGRASPSGLTVFPTPRVLAAIPVDELRARVGVTGSRARTLQGVAALFADGFDLAPGASSAAAREVLLAVPGVGPWTVEYLAMRVLHDADAFPAGDLVLRRALGVEKQTEVLSRAEAWRPYRSYAAMRLWTDAVARAAAARGRRPVPYET